MQSTQIQSYNIVSHFSQLEHFTQTLLENFLQMFIHKLLLCLKKYKMDSAENGSFNKI